MTKATQHYAGVDSDYQNKRKRLLKNDMRMAFSKNVKVVNLEGGQNDAGCKLIDFKAVSQSKLNKPCRHIVLETCHSACCQIYPETIREGHGGVDSTPSIIRPCRPISL